MKTRIMCDVVLTSEQCSHPVYCTGGQACLYHDRTKPNYYPDVQIHLYVQEDEEDPILHVLSNGPACGLFPKSKNTPIKRKSYPIPMSTFNVLWGKARKVKNIVPIVLQECELAVNNYMVLYGPEISLKESPIPIILTNSNKVINDLDGWVHDTDEFTENYDTLVSAYLKSIQSDKLYLGTSTEVKHAKSILTHDAYHRGGYRPKQTIDSSYKDILKQIDTGRERLLTTLINNMIDSPPIPNL